MSDLDYREIDYPTDKPRSEWGHAARRAYILEQELEEVGHPDLINWSRLAREFDKSKSTIHNDKQKLLKYIVDETDEARVKQIGLSIFEKGLLRISSDDDYDPFDEASFFKMWASTLDEFGLIDLDDDEDDDLFVSGEGEGAGVTVQIAGVSGDDVDDDELPERDRPGGDEDEADPEEAVEA